MGGGGGGRGWCSEQCNIYINYFNKYNNNAEHANIYFGIGWKLCWSSLCNSIRVIMQSARQWQEQILYLLELQ